MFISNVCRLSYFVSLCGCSGALHTFLCLHVLILCVYKMFLPLSSIFVSFVVIFFSLCSSFASLWEGSFCISLSDNSHFIHSLGAQGTPDLMGCRACVQ